MRRDDAWGLSLLCLLINAIKLSKNNKDYLFITKLCRNFVASMSRKRALVSDIS